MMLSLAILFTLMLAVVLLNPPFAPRFSLPGLLFIGSGQLAIAIGAVPLALTFAFVNHRSAERSRGRIVQQAIWIIAAAMVGVAILAGVSAYVGPMRR
jgi:hypothetical protein